MRSVVSTDTSSPRSAILGATSWTWVSTPPTNGGSSERSPRQRGSDSSTCNGAGSVTRDRSSACQSHPETKSAAVLHLAPAETERVRRKAGVPGNGGACRSGIPPSGRPQPSCRRRHPHHQTDTRTVRLADRTDAPAASLRNQCFASDPPRQDPEDARGRRCDHRSSRRQIPPSPRTRMSSAVEHLGEAQRRPPTP